MNKFRKGWEIKSLGDIATISSGGTPSKNNMEYWKNGTIPWIRTTEVQNCVLSEEDVQEFITESGLKNSSAKLVPAGTILLAMIGQGKTRGQVAYLSFEASTNQNCATIVFREGYDSKFYFQYLLSKYESIRGMSNSAGQSNLSGTLVKSIKVPTPPLPEQIKIAEILSTWDNAIQTTEKQLDNSQQQKKALMQMLLSGEKRVGGFSGEWCECYLSEIAYITTGSSNRQDSSSEGEYTFFDRSEDIRKSNIYLFDKEAVIVAGEGQQFTPKYFVGKFDLHQRTYAIMDFQLCVGKFIYYLIDFKKDYFLSQAVGSTVKSLRLPMFQKMKLMLPKSIEEQQKIAEILTTADQEIDTLQKKLECLKLEKRALMQKLL